jgi:hypothetical protein
MKAFAYGIAFAGLVLGARSATADSSLDRVRACMPQQDDAARLACYDKELGRTAATVPTGAAPGTPTRSATAAVPAPGGAPVAAGAPAMRGKSVTASTPATATATATVPARTAATAAVPTPTTVSATAAAAPATAPAKSADFGMTPELLRKQQVQAGLKPPPPPPPQALSAKVAKVGTYGNGLLVVTLDNGQVWEQQESGEALLEVGDPVKISRGTFGSLWMDNASHRRIRVKRVQ